MSEPRRVPCPISYVVALEATEAAVKRAVARQKCVMVEAAEALHLAPGETIVGVDPAGAVLVRAAPAKEAP